MQRRTFLASYTKELRTSRTPTILQRERGSPTLKIGSQGAETTRLLRLLLLPLLMLEKEMSGRREEELTDSDGTLPPALLLPHPPPPCVSG